MLAPSDILLPVLVRVDAAKERLEDHPIKQEAALPNAVADAGDGDQTSDVLRPIASNKTRVADEGRLHGCGLPSIVPREGEMSAGR